MSNPTNQTAEELGGAVKDIVEDRRFSCPDGELMHREFACGCFGDDEVETADETNELEGLSDGDVETFLDARRDARIFGVCPEGEVMHSEGACETHNA